MSNSTQTTVDQIKRNEFVKFRDTETAPIWKFTHYSRSDKRFYFSAVDDFNNEISKKRGTICFVGFTY